MSDQSADTPREEEPEVEGHLKALMDPAEDMAARSGEPDEYVRSDVEGHRAVFEPSERQLRSGEAGDAEGADVEGHMAPLGTEERPVRKPPEKPSQPKDSEVEGHMTMFRAAEPARKKG